jgi:cysteine-rich repeat protein
VYHIVNARINHIRQHRYLVGTCGNGKVEAGLGEACDDGNNIDLDGCSSTCAVETGWTCTTVAPYTSFSVCTETKDGIWRGGLACDDNNAVNTDGCSNTGTINTGWYCTGSIGSADTCY